MLHRLVGANESTKVGQRHGSAGKKACYHTPKNLSLIPWIHMVEWENWSSDIHSLILSLTHTLNVTEKTCFKNLQRQAKYKQRLFHSHPLFYFMPSDTRL